VFKDQNSQLLQEFASLSQQLGEAQEEYGLLEHHLNRLLGEPVALETVTIDECEELEKSLKTALERIEAKKVANFILYILNYISIEHTYGIAQELSPLWQSLYLI